MLLSNVLLASNLKSKLLLPEDNDEDFKALEVAEKLKLQLKKLGMRSNMRIIKFMLKFLVHIFPKNEKYICFSSFPDNSDNSKRVYEYLLNNRSGLKLFWLISNFDFGIEF